MKTILLSFVLALTLAFSASAADVSMKLTDVHLCCQGCVKGVQKATGNISGVTADADMDSDSISLSGPDTATVQKAVDALTAAGYYGKSSNPDIKVNGDTGAKDEKVKSLKVEGVHVCCGKCVKSIGEALSAVPGVTGNTATKGAKSFTISGDFNEKDAMAALQKAGLTGHVAQ